MALQNQLPPTSSASSAIAVPATSEGKGVLAHQIFGDGPEKVIVLHDWMGDAENYSTVHKWLDPTRFTYVFTDVRGYGGSKTLKGEYTTEEVADDIFVLADHLGWDTFNLIGHSMNAMSGFRALQLDWNGKRRIKRMVAVTPVTPDGYPASIDDRAFLSSAILDDDTAMAAFDMLTGGKLNHAWAANKTARNRAQSDREAMRAYYDMWLGENFLESFASANIETPVLVIGGRNDLSGFQEEHFVASLEPGLPNIEYAYIENAGHYPMQETPVLFATLVEKYLA